MHKSVLVSIAAVSLAAAWPASAPAKSHLSYSRQQLTAARQEVRIATTEGPAAVKALQRQVTRRHARLTTVGPPAMVGPTAAQQALAVALYQGGAVAADTTTGSTLPAPAPPAGIASSGPTPMLRSGPVAHSASCWGKESSWWNHTIAGGAIVAKLQKFNNGWCGTGTQLTSGAYNFDHWSWAQYPYCLTSMSNRQGPDGTSGNWAHGGIWATTGIYSVAVVCVPVLGGEHAVIRVAGNGYWDKYDDYGF